MLFAMVREVNKFPVLFALILFCGCSLHPARGVKSCKYAFRSMSFIGLDANHSHWRVEVAVANPNGHEVTLTRMRYAVLHQADTLFSGWNPEKRVLASRDSQIVSTTLELPNSILQRLPAGIWTQSEAEFRIVADAYLNTWMGDMVVPGAIRETFKVDMRAHAARFRDQLLQRLFGWPQAPPENPRAPGNPGELRHQAPPPNTGSGPDETL